MNEAERWPVYELIEQDHKDYNYYSADMLIEIDPDLLQRYREAEQVFESLRQEIGELVYANRIKKK